MSASDKIWDSSDRFEARRRRLLKPIIDYTEGKPLPKGFHHDFDEYLENLVFGLVRDGEDFYASFTRDMLRKIDFTLNWPLATVIHGTSIELRINPISFLFLREKEAGALWKHEVLHLILDHHTRQSALKSRFSSLAINLAMDAAVNQYIPALPSFCEKLSSLNARLELDLKDNETLEQYAAKIDAALREQPEAQKSFEKEHNIDFCYVHSAWTQGNDLRLEESREKIHTMLNNARKRKLPEELRSFLSTEGGTLIDWRRILRKTLISMPAGKRRTVTRRNRRQPERLELKGELRNYVPEVIVAVDISASIQDQEIRQYLKEILGIIRSYSRSLRILECDDRIRADYRITSLEDVRPKTLRSGGTRFSPVFERLRWENQNRCLLVYFTDGEGEEKLSVEPLHQTLWVVSGNSLSLSDPRGKVVFLGDRSQPQVDHLYGLQAMRELLHEWAR